MSPPKNKKSHVPPPRRSFLQDQNQLPSSPAQGRRRPTTADQSNSSSEAKSHSAFPQTSQTFDAHSFRNPIFNRLPPPSIFPREAQTILQARSTKTSSRGGRKKMRKYPEFQQESVSEPPQNGPFQQALKHVDGVVKKTTNTLLMMPTDMQNVGVGLPVFTTPRDSTPPSSTSTSYTSKELQSNKDGCHSVINKSLDGESQPIHERGDQGAVKPGPKSLKTNVDKPLSSSIARNKSTRRVDMACNTCSNLGEQDLVEAMEGLKIFKDLRPEPNQVDVSHKKVPEAAADKDNVATKSSITVKNTLKAPTATSELISAFKINSLTKEAVTHPQEGTYPGDGLSSVFETAKGTANTGEPSIEEISRETENIMRSLPLKRSYQSVEEIDAEAAAVIDQAVANLKSRGHEEPNQDVSKASAIAPLASTFQEGPPVRSSSVQGVVSLGPRPVEEAAKDDERAEFEDVDLSIPTRYEASESYDGDFEVIESDRCESARNGRPGVWGRWVQGKR